MRVANPHLLLKSFHLDSPRGRMLIIKWVFLRVVDVLGTVLSHGFTSGGCVGIEATDSCRLDQDQIVFFVFDFFKLHVHMALLFDHLFVLRNLVVLQVLNHLKDIRRLLPCVMRFHPVHNHARRICTLHLLHICSIDISPVVAGWPDADVVDVHFSDDVFTGKGGVFFNEFFVPKTRCQKLILARLAAIHVVVGVEKRSIAEHPGHFPTLMCYLKSGVLVDDFDFD